MDDSFLKTGGTPSDKSNNAGMDFSLAITKHVEVVGNEVDLTPPEERNRLTPPEERNRLYQQGDPNHQDYARPSSVGSVNLEECSNSQPTGYADHDDTDRPPSSGSINSLRSVHSGGGSRFTVNPVPEASTSIASLNDSISSGNSNGYRFKALPYSNASFSSFSDSLSSFYNGEDDEEDIDREQGIQSSISSLNQCPSTQPLVNQNMYLTGTTVSRFITTAVPANQPDCSTPMVPNTLSSAVEGNRTITFADKCTYHTISYEYGNDDRVGGDDVMSPTIGDYSDDSSYYDSVSSTSSTATLLRKVVAHDIDDIMQHHTDDDRSLEYPKQSIPNVCVHRVAKCHIEPEVSGLMQGSGTGQALLAQSLDQVRKSFEDLSPVFLTNQVTPASDRQHEQEKQVAQLSSTYIRNLIVLSIGFMLAYTAFFSLRNLQSSINHEGGLGLIGMSTVYASFLLGCIFAPSIVNCMRPKSAIVLSMHGNLASVLANFYPTFYTLVPASAILGFTMAILWTAQGTYITSLAITYAALTNKSHDAILGLFIGFFLFLVQIAQILGNLISSSVFMLEMSGTRQIHDTHKYTADQNASIFDNPDVKFLPLLSPGNDSLDQMASQANQCGAAYCHSYKIDHAQEGTELDQHTLYILLGIFTALTMISILVLAICLNKLDVIFRKSSFSMRKQLLAIFSLHKDKRLLAFVPLMTYVGIEEAFIFGEITKVCLNFGKGHM